MCLHHDGIERVAGKDIRTWKNIRISPDGKVWRGLYEYNDKVFPFDEVCEENGMSDTVSQTAGSGFFHSCVDEESLTYFPMMDMSGGRFPYTFVEVAVAECTVPAGSRYFTDANGCEIASDTIVVESPGDFSFDMVLDLNERLCAYI